MKIRLDGNKIIVTDVKEGMYEIEYLKECFNKVMKKSVMEHIKSIEYGEEGLVIDHGLSFFTVGHICDNLPEVFEEYEK